MKENTNKSIAINSVILYFKMAITIVCSIFSTRYALQALGVVDFGLHSVLGGIIAMIGILNVIMVSTSNRFIAVAIGRGDIVEANRQFNVNLSVHIVIAIVTLLFAFPIGYWYIHHFLNYSGALSTAIMVYNISIIASVISFVGVPYNGLLMAKEKFIVFSIADIISHLGILLISYILLTHFSQKLFVYTLATACFTVLSVAINIIYCTINYRLITKFRFVRDRKRYKEVVSFSMWVAVGAIAMVGKNQGAVLLVNAFFSTVMNAAMGVANSVARYVGVFSQNIIQPMAPQITKSYAADNTERTNELLLMSTKYGFLLMLLASSFFLVEPQWVLELWLADVPEYASIFLVLLIVDNLVQSLNSGIYNLIFASGKIQLYQIFVSTLNVLSIFLGYLVLKTGAPAYGLVVTYVVISLIKFFVIQWTLRHSLKYDTSVLVKKSYIPSLLIVILFMPMALLNFSLHPLVHMIIAGLYLVVLIVFLGLSKKERTFLFEKIGIKIGH